MKFRSTKADICHSGRFTLSEDKVSLYSPCELSTFGFWIQCSTTTKKSYNSDSLLMGQTGKILLTEFKNEGNRSNGLKVAEKLVFTCFDLLPI